MKCMLKCTSVTNDDEIVDKYPIIRKYYPAIAKTPLDYEILGVTVMVDDLFEFYHDIGKPIILDTDKIGNTEMPCLTIYDD